MKESNLSRETLLTQRRELMASLREGMNKGAPDKEIASLLDEVNDAYDRLGAIRHAERQDMGNILTPRQHAKLLLMSVRGRR